MNILLWTLQALLALHTLIGAGWKLANPAQTVPSLNAIPHTAWLTLSILEVICALALVLPSVKRSLAPSAPIAALAIVAEMLLFVTLGLRSGGVTTGEVAYWLIVAALSAFVAFGRLTLSR